MIFHPREGQAVRLHYAKSWAAFMPWHGAEAVVEIVGRGPGPRNVGVRIGDRLVTAPRGNLVAIDAAQKKAGPIRGPIEPGVPGPSSVPDPAAQTKPDPVDPALRRTVEQPSTSVQHAFKPRAARTSRARQTAPIECHAGRVPVLRGTPRRPRALIPVLGSGPHCP